MNTKTCAHCGGTFQVEPDRPPAFCPFCGMALESAAVRSPSDLEAALRKAKKPKDKFNLIMEALAKNPDDFEANEALLYHGRVHETLSRLSHGKLDFSTIPCHLLAVLERPEDYTDAETGAKFEELLRGPQLQKTMRLAENPEAFFVGYLRRMALDYINLFIQGDSRNTKMAFGFGRSQASAAKACARPVQRMLENLRTAPQVDDKTRDILRRAIVDGYGSVFAGYGELLYE